MTGPVPTTTGTFHEGELAVQRQAGVASDAARLAGMLAPAELRGGVTRFLADRTFAAITARDADGALWISPLTGPPGFLEVTAPTVLNVRAWPAAGDPLHQLPTHQPIGLIVIEFAARRRVRINGTLSRVSGDGLHIAVEQAYGNCPQYIQSRQLHPAAAALHGVEPARRRGTLTQDDADLIRRSDTFFIGTSHPTRGNDASHRGGPPGFVRVEDGALWWPDYRGNNMFNTLGNLQTDSAAALLFSDFTTGRTVQLSGSSMATSSRRRFVGERWVVGSGGERQEQQPGQGAGA